MIQIPVYIHSKSPDGQPLRQDAFTLVVNAHGCLLSMANRPEPGEQLLLVNPKTGVEQSGKVIRAERSRDGGFAVAFEFDTPRPQIWSVVFPPEDWKLPEPQPQR